MGSRQDRQPKQRHAPASDDERFTDPPGGVEAAERLVAELIDPPAEFPCQGAALEGLHLVVDAIRAEIEGAGAVAERIRLALPSCPLLDPIAARAQVIAAFARRRKYHAHYLAVVHAGLNRSANPGAPDGLMQPVHRLLGAWCLRRSLDSWQPSRHSMSNVLAALSRPSSRTSRAWPIEQRQRAAADAVHELRVAISKNPTAAAGLGLAQVKAEPDTEGDPIEEFNKRFRRRMSDLLEYKSTDIQAGAGGHGALSASGLKRAGRELLIGIGAGQHKDMHVGLEALSQLTSELVQRLPVQLDVVPPDNALGWVDIPAGTYNYFLFKLIERGARPEPGTESLYEATTQLVKVGLSPPLAVALRMAAREVTDNCRTVGELLGKVQHGPRDAVTGDGPYRVTARKLQVSLPALLLQHGHARWVVSLAMSSPALVSRGRPAYGVARQADVDAVVDAAHDLLGWPRAPRRPDDGALIGSFVTPRLQAVRLAFIALATDANATSRDPATVGEVVGRLNAHAAYLSMLVAFTFSLRDRVVYKLPTRGLYERGPLKFNDKDVHDFSMPAVPMLGTVAAALEGWTSLVRDSMAVLDRIGTPEAVELKERLSSRLLDRDSPGWLFTISISHTLEAVGTHSWRSRLPRSLRLVGNFGRQFWPDRLLSKGLRQAEVDVLMRHQMPALHPGSSHVCVPEQEIHERLVAAMTEAVEQDLQLTPPIALDHQSNGR